MASGSAKKKLAENELTDVVNNLAHDLRTPLACLKGYLSLLDEGKYAPGSPEWTEFFSLCMSECDHIETLIQSVLESAVRDPEVVLHCEPVLVPALINEVVKEVSALNGDRRFVVDVQPDAGTVWADPLRLEQVVRNLVDNAVKYSPDDTLVVIRVRRRGNATLFSVSDQGYGIAPEHLNRLFERFYRVRDSHSLSVRGTGLGLPIARMVVEAHGGEIWAESVQGRGSTFHFTLPAHAAEVAFEGGAAEGQACAGGQASAGGGER